MSMTREQIEAFIVTTIARSDENWQQKVNRIVARWTDDQSDEYWRGHEDGMATEREVHYG